jgi:hypothetical protein
MMPSPLLQALLAAAVAVGGAAGGIGTRGGVDTPKSAPLSTPTVDFTRDIAPVLAAHCFQCHGPDASSRKAGLRLDKRDGALKGGKSGAAAIVPGKPDESELLARVTSTDASSSVMKSRCGSPARCASVLLPVCLAPLSTVTGIVRRWSASAEAARRGRA